MTYVLNGGGSAAQTKAVDEAVTTEMPRRTMLYVPHATAPEPWSFEKAEEWLREHDAFKDLEITTWRHIEGRLYGELDDFDAIYVMGGNTFRLLGVLHETGFTELLEKFAISKRVICGISAGAIVLGQGIGTASIGTEADENEVGLTDLRGLDVLNGFHIHTHYKNSDRAEIERYAAEEEDRKVVCIPEDAGIVVHDSHSEAVGESDVMFFVGGDVKSVSPGMRISPESPLSLHAPVPEDLY